MEKLNKIFSFDIKLFINILFIIGIGLLTIYSVSFENPGFNNFKRQVLFVTLALIIFWITSRMNYGIWKNYAGVMYLLGLLLMVIVLFLGEEKHGTVGWLGASTYHLQPVELIKMATILILAKYFSKIKPDDKRLRHLIISGAYCFVPVVLALAQPDLGSAAVIVSVWLILLLIWGIKRRQAIVLLGVALVISLLSWLIFLKPYQKARVTTFLNPGADPAGSGYHIIQSITAIGSGGIHGKGLGYGSQSQLHFLPEAHTDFIYSVIGEELGFIGAIILIIGFSLLFLKIYKIACNSIDNFGRFIVIGTMGMLFVQFMVNIGMNIGLVPITGLPLPLVSYGGSALLTSMFLLGIVFNIDTTSRKLEGYLND
ncbi:MAG: rod shape-determining protein RodA [Patescibacteria group bacterium]|nr:rod shape-determining protein RodA [Patescibacteria group bacterium]